ncbi:PD-(D/E)XK nuclease family protein [Salinigranum halophilum]|uniref:PD-(D/E)XK nuclease family protein n=1 Tax=Salinigranum halophilum TaxID=2565931 RepID=UPI0010A78973|nr:PD-(D/E)XK nuclease family protein [Salinigranum halophilum]
MTDRTVLTGPTHSQLEATAFERADTTTDGGIGRVLYIPSNGDRRDAAHDHWRSVYPRLSFRPETLTGLVYHCYERLNGPSEQLSDQSVRRAVEQGVDKVAHTHDWFGSESHASASLVSAFDSRFARFENVGLTTPEAVHKEFDHSPLSDRVARTTVNAYDGMHDSLEQLRQPWEFKRSEAISTVTSSGSVSELLPHVDVLVLAGFYEFSPLEWEFIHWLVEALPTIATLPSFSESGETGVDVASADARSRYVEAGFDVERVSASNDGRPLTALTKELYRNREPKESISTDAIHWRALPTPEREIRYVARELRTVLESGVEPTDIGVVIPGLPSYEEYVHDTFETYEIPYRVESGEKFGRTNLGSVVAALCTLADEKPPSSAATELSTNPLITTFSAVEETAIVSAERGSDSPRLAAVLTLLPDELVSKLQSVQSELRLIQEQDVATGLCDLRRLLDDLGVIATLETEPDSIDIDLELAAYETLDEVIASFTRSPDQWDTLTPMAALKRGVDGLPVSSYEPDQEEVPVMNLIDAEAQTFDELYLVGLTAQHLPNVAQDPVYFDQMVEAHPRLESVDDRDLARYLFAMLLANARHVTMTMPSTEGSETIVQSPVLDEIQRITDFEPVVGTDDRIGSREDLQRALAPLPNRRAAVDEAGQRGELTPVQTVRYDRGIVCASNRGTPGPSPHNGTLEPDVVDQIYGPATREPFSASRIERYVNCGFQFYAKEILDFDEDETYERTPNPLERGRFIHDVFERFYADLQGVPGEPVEIATHTQSELEQHMLDVAIDVLDGAEFEYDNLFYRRWLEELFAGLGTSDTNPYFSGKRPLEGIERGLFVRFVEHERAQDRETYPAWFEAPFGAGLPESTDADAFSITLPNGSELPFRGYIDRIDLDNLPESTVQLYDYKTGSTPYLTKTTGGTKFQLPLYLLAARSFFADRGKTIGALQASYYQVKPPSSLYVPRGIESKFDSQEELAHFLDVIVPERLQSISTAIEHGRFQTTLLGSREAGCSYCDYRRACDIRHHQRSDAIEASEADEHVYVPLRVTDHSLELNVGGDDDAE